MNTDTTDLHSMCAVLLALAVAQLFLIVIIYMRLQRSTETITSKLIGVNLIMSQLDEKVSRMEEVVSGIEAAVTEETADVANVAQELLDLKEQLKNQVPADTSAAEARLDDLYARLTNVRANVKAIFVTETQPDAGIDAIDSNGEPFNTRDLANATVRPIVEQTEQPAVDATAEALANVTQGTIGDAEADSKSNDNSTNDAVSTCDFEDTGRVDRI